MCCEFDWVLWFVGSIRTLGVVGEMACGWGMGEHGLARTNTDNSPNPSGTAAPNEFGGGTHVPVSSPERALGLLDIAAVVAACFAFDEAEGDKDYLVWRPVSFHSSRRT